MLLSRPIARRCSRKALPGDEALSIRTGMPAAPNLFRSQHLAPARFGGIECLVEIADNVVDVLDADAEPDHFRPYAGLRLLLRRHLPVRGGGGMAGQRLRVAHVDESLDELERVVQLLAGLEPAADAERHQRAGAPAEIFLRKLVIGAVGEAGIVDPFHPRIVAKE